MASRAEQAFAALAQQDAQGRRNGQEPQPKTLIVRTLSSIRPERVDFLWKPYLPKGRPVALEGDPGVGKSSLVAKIIAHLTTGQAFPNVLEGAPPPKEFTPCHVCLLTSEDDPGDTIRPRIEVNGGDLDRVHLIEGWEQPDGERGIVTMQDLALLEHALKTYHPALLVFDPIQSFFGRGVDMNQANDTRPVLDAIGTLCKAHQCTPLYVRHIGKARRDKAIHAGLGSIDITGNMRSVLFLGEDPDASQRRILAQSKVNNAQRGQSLAYTITTVEQDIYLAEGDVVTVEAPRLQWDGLSTLTANDLASPPLCEDDEDRSELDQAKEMLVRMVQDGPMLYEEIQQAAKETGCSLATVRRAKPLIGVKVRRRKLEGKNAREWPWEWYLPEELSPGVPPLTHSDEHLEHLEDVIEK